MMDVSQSMDLKELPTKNEIVKRIVKELDHEVDKVTSPDTKGNKSKSKTTVNDKDVINGLEAIEQDDEMEPSSPIDSIANHTIDTIIITTEQRDAGCDLDDLLDKISSIVDCEPKETSDEQIEDTNLIEEANANDIDNKAASNPAIDDIKEDVINSDDVEKEQQTDDNADIEQISEVEDQLIEQEDKGKVMGKENGKRMSETAINDTENKKNLNSDEEFLDALDNISSSDDFDELTSIIDKSVELKLHPDNQNGLEDITSDDEHVAKLNTNFLVIDLDLSQLKDADEQMEVHDVESTDKSKDNKAEEIKTSGTQELTDATMDDILIEDADKLEDNVNEEEPEMEKPKDVDTDIKETNGILEEETENDAESTSKLKRLSEDVGSKTIVAKKEIDPKEAESDDDVIFFESLEKASIKSETNESSVADAVQDVETDVKEVSDKKVDEVVLVSEDEDEIPTPKKPEKQSEQEATTTRDSAIDASISTDNSDNACDLFEKSKTGAKRKLSISDDVNSNSSNLLQPSLKCKDQTAPAAETDAATECKVETATECEAEAGAECEAEAAAECKSEAAAECKSEAADECITDVKAEAEAQAVSESEAEPIANVRDVEMMADETAESSLPSVKRLRLSTEDKPETSSNSPNTTTTTTDTDIKPVVGKRSHSQLDSTASPPEKEVTPNKKIKRNDSESNSSNDDNLQIDLDPHDKTAESVAKTSTEPAKLKPEEDSQPECFVELKPTPKLKVDVKPLRLDFSKRFRKSFDKMTRLDLEELVTQKIIEVMLVKSEFADLRCIADKHETILGSYRRKIAEVTKQFLDLETVHKRVLKDLEIKNAHFTAPVRITRAVGLQVGMTLIKKPSDESRQNAGSAHTAGSMSASTSTTPPKVTTTSMRSPMRANAPRGAQQQPQHQHHPQNQHPQQQQQQQQQQRSSLANIHPSSSGTPPVRRGCMQKVTPQRPVNVSSNSLQASTSQSVQRMQTMPPSGPNVRPMYATKHTANTTPPAATATAAVAAAATMRSRGNFKPANKDYPASFTQQKQQQQQQQQQLQQQQLQLQQQQMQLQQQPTPVRLGRSPNKSPMNMNAKQRSSIPMGGGTVSVPIANATDPSTSSAYGQSNLVPARPKEKAVIDLTDEDDAAAVAAAAAAADINARLRQTINTSGKRSMQQNSPMGPAGGSNARPVAGSVVRVSPMNVTRTSVVSRQIVSTSGAGQRNTISSNVTMQIRSENTPPRLRFSHPAPLPLAPPQTFHPDWKLPPSRPVIRISLHDAGIVISWTLEDTGSRFAECVTYQIYAYQETINEPSSDSWRHVGDVKAMLLPMAVTLNQFQENQRYYFAVRGVDAHDRYGVFSLPKTW